MKRPWQFLLSLLIALSGFGLAPSALAVAPHPLLDDAGQTWQPRAPARRIISLAPDFTEILFAIGAGEYVVGAVDYSDFPDAARQIPRIGSSARFDFERIVSLRPDLIVAWRGGNPASQIEGLRALDLPVFELQTRRLGDVPRVMQTLGQLTGEAERADQVAATFEQGMRQLQQRYMARRALRVFYEIWHQPLQTIGGEQILTDVLALCGGRNIFAELDSLAPQVGLEAVMQRRPEVVLFTPEVGRLAESKARWQIWNTLPAVQQGHLYALDPDLLHRAGPRLLQGTQQLCEALDRARQTNE
jgi:iron complex transport system substrate-binding protein